MAIVGVLAFIIIAALISLSIGWLFNKFRIFKVNYLVQAEGEPVAEDLTAVYARTKRYAEAIPSYEKLVDLAYGD